ncbi:substrate-binding domain-containing protein [Metabacillus malikii]|uniref:Ribose transport system substrate-binding protein n=1 Tax=Metabacillus malikii TaxID=1504265 RepID=A0ABT9ZAV2_9BACI|nr:substrate-binding domain-containing protein [Metabacillus malikii]MDQ0229377.1 ribose transport system substrate-binding protein [Metabacillus malikii]
MKKLLYVYVLLFILFFMFIFHIYLRHPLTNPFSKYDEQLINDDGDEYVMVTFQAGIDYWKNAIKGFEDAATELDVYTEYRGATQYDVYEQITVLEQVIAKKPAGIAISAINPDELNTTINKAVEAGIPVVLFDSDAPESAAHTFLGTNNYAAGEAGANKMADLLDGKGKVAVVTLPKQLNHQERTNGFIDTIRDKHPNIEIVAIKDGKGDQLKSEQAARDILQHYPDVNGIFATEANGGVGIANALEAYNNNELKIISFDTDKQTLDKIRDGHISATLAQGTWNMGYWSLQFLVQQNEEYDHGLYTGTTKLPNYVDTGISIVTNDNVEEYYAD